MYPTIRIGDLVKVEKDESGQSPNIACAYGYVTELISGQPASARIKFTDYTGIAFYRNLKVVKSATR